MLMKKSKNVFKRVQLKIILNKSHAVIGAKTKSKYHRPFFEFRVTSKLLTFIGLPHRSEMER